MGKVIIFKEDGCVTVCSPTPECLLTRTIEEIAVKDVPAGLPYKIIDVEDLPFEYPQEVWEVDDLDLDDGVGGPSHLFPDDPNYLINE